MDYYRNSEQNKPFHTLENFHKNLQRKHQFGISLFDCEAAIEEACQFFGLSVPTVVNDLTDKLQGSTFVRPGNPRSYADDQLNYSLAQLSQLGIHSKDAFSLVITHECTHLVLQDTHFPGLNGGRWEQELCCDFFMGVRAALDKMPMEALNAVRSGLGQSSGSPTHPTGHLRYEVISYGHFWVGNFDVIHNQRRTFNDYMQNFWSWLNKNAATIRQEQMPFIG